MARTDNFTNFATDVADSIRSMTGKTDKIPAADFDTEIRSIETKEDLNEELNTYDTEVTEQGVSIDTIINALEGKAAGSGPGNNSAKPLYLIANGYDITDNTGGYTFNQTAGTVTNAVGIKQGTESLNLYTGLWAHCDITFNNDFDVSKYSYLCIDFAYPSTNVIDSMKQYIGIYAHFVTSGTRIALVEGRTTDRVTIRLPLAGVTSPQQIKISCANLSGSNGQNSSAYTEAHPLMIYNVWLEDELSLQEKTIEINDEYMLDIIPDEGFYGLSKVSIKVNPNKYAAYQMLEYIKGTSYVAGSNYFLTGLYPTNKTTLEMKYSFYKNDNNYSNLYGSSRQFLAQSTTANDTRVVALWNNELIGNMSGFNNFNAHVIKQDKNVMYFDGSVVKTCTNAEWQDENELKLFGLTGGQDASAILYYCKIWEDDVLVRDFVPCYRKSDNAVGLLDKVENKFYENAGSVAFEKGPNI